MQINVERIVPSALSTIGMLTLDESANLPTVWTLEPPAAPDDRGIKCVPAGIYKVTIEPSKRFLRDMPRLHGVPGWPLDDVLIHWGNYPDNTEGCILVGLTRAPNFIGASREAFDILFPKLQAPASAGVLTIKISAQDITLPDTLERAA